MSQAAALPPLQRPRPSRGHAALQQDVTLFTPPPSGDRFLIIESASRLKSSIGGDRKVAGSSATTVWCQLERPKQKF